LAINCRWIHNTNSNSYSESNSKPHLNDTIFTKVAHFKSKDIWDKNIYEGDTKVKATKLQTYRGQFEQLKMKEDEDITAYFWMTLLGVKNLILKSLDLDTIRQKRDQAPKQQRKKQI
jgi:hypothetical protein